MKSTLALLPLLVAAATAFTLSVPSAASRSCATGIPTQRSSLVAPTALFSDKKEDEEEGLDLNLEEMFTMFEAADKDENFDKAIKKVKE